MTQRKGDGPKLGRPRTIKDMRAAGYQISARNLATLERWQAASKAKSRSAALREILDVVEGIGVRRLFESGGDG